MTFAITIDETKLHILHGTIRYTCRRY